MRPAEIKAKIQAAYSEAMAKTNMQRSRSSSFPMQFRDLKLYGRDSGADFVETNLEVIVNEAISAAECKQTSLVLPFYGSGRAALEGIAATLRDFTALKIEIHQSTVTLIWAVPNPGFV